MSSLHRSAGEAGFRMVTPEEALPGRVDPMPVADAHAVNGHRISPPFPDGLRRAVVAMGCFWGAERLFWQADGVYATAVGYTGGFTPNPTYDEVCSGRTGHAEAVLVVFEPVRIGYSQILRLFWENHDPTQGMRQGNDLGTQYRSAIYTIGGGQARRAEKTARVFGCTLAAAGYPAITTEIRSLTTFFYAEPYHQQYLAKNPTGYCPAHATGVSYPTD